MEQFEFSFEPGFRWFLRLFGATSTTAVVEVDADRLRARFGFVRVETSLENVTGAQQTGPYRWYRAIGVRLSLADRGLTFGSTTRGGVCIRFREPVVGLGGRLRHPGLTVTVADPDRLVAALTPGSAQAAGTP